MSTLGENPVRLLEWRTGVNFFKLVGGFISR